MADTLGGWAFLIGVILAIIFGFITGVGGWLTWVLVILGLIVGLLNIADKEVQPFLMAGTVLVIVSAFGGNVFPEGFIKNILDNMLFLFVPATIVVALKSVLKLAKK